MLNNLKFVQLSSQGANGYENKKLYANQQLVVSTAQGTYSIPISEYVIAGMMCLSKRALSNYILARSIPCYRKLEIDNLYDVELEQAIISIFGCGDIGTLIAKKLNGLGCKKIIGVNRSGVDKSSIFTEMRKLTACNDAITESDFIISCMPENNDSIEFWDYNKFKIMKNNVIFVNVGRGSAVVFKDLQKALNKKIISGALIDVSDPEPIPLIHPFRFTRRLVLTNHSSFYSNYNNTRLLSLYKRQLINYAEHNPLEHTIQLY